MDIFALCSNKIQSQNYTFVIPLFLLIQKLYEKSSVSHAHSGLKKYTTFNYLSLLIRASGLGLNCISITSQISKEFYYLGHMNSNGNAKEFMMPNTDKSAVEIEWILEEPVREDIYEYIVNA